VRTGRDAEGAFAGPGGVQVHVDVEDPVRAGVHGILMPVDRGTVAGVLEDE